MPEQNNDNTFVRKRDEVFEDLLYREVDEKDGLSNFDPR